MDAGRYVPGGFDRVIAKLHKAPIGVLTVNAADTGSARAKLEEKILHTMGFGDKKEYTHNIPGEYHCEYSRLWGIISDGYYEENSYPGDGFYSIWTFDIEDWKPSNIFLLCEYFENLLNTCISKNEQSPILVYPTVDDIKKACRPVEVDINHHLWFCEDWKFEEGK